MLRVNKRFEIILIIWELVTSWVCLGCGKTEVYIHKYYLRFIIHGVNGTLPKNSTICFWFIIFVVIVVVLFISYQP